MHSSTKRGRGPGEEGLGPGTGARGRRKARPGKRSSAQADRASAPRPRGTIDPAPRWRTAQRPRHVPRRDRGHDRRGAALPPRRHFCGCARVPFGGPAMSTDTKRDQGPGALRQGFRVDATRLEIAPFANGLRRDGRFSSFLLHPSSLGVPRRAAGSCGPPHAGLLDCPPAAFRRPPPTKVSRREAETQRENPSNGRPIPAPLPGGDVMVGASTSAPRDMQLPSGGAAAIGKERQEKTRAATPRRRGTRTERRAQKTVPPDACRTSLALGCGTAAGYESGCLQRREIKKIFPLRRGVSARVSEKRSWVLGFRS